MPVSPPALAAGLPQPAVRFLLANSASVLANFGSAVTVHSTVHIVITFTGTVHTPRANN
ncbi:hypothetical protein SLEP1_g27608 [Rubroshorea leprosula]|uniref:Uncharacterized protein n=1 Tax=Rubroshorea leprosula TaxID=152421 RepID=A0AAV5K2A8_9ROSI|nr:hypothetical protein SLEP1_g27608 [Rubroshorea leprosula]